MNGSVFLSAIVLAGLSAQGVPPSRYDLYVAVRTSTLLKVGEEEIAELTVGEVLPVLDIRNGWLQTCRVLGDAEQLGWVPARHVVPSCHPLSRRYVPFALEGEELAKWRDEKRWYVQLSEYLDVSEDGNFTLTRADAIRVARLHSPEYCARREAYLQTILNRESEAAENTTAPTSASARSRDEVTLFHPWERYRQEFCIRVAIGGKAVRKSPRQDYAAAGAPQPLSPRVHQPVSAGYLDLLVSQLRNRNLESNVAGIQDSLHQVETLFEAGREDDRQSIELTRQTLYASQSALLSEQNGYEAMLDSYKVTLGLPPDLPVRIEDSLLDQFNLIDARLMAAQAAVNGLLTRVRDDRTYPVLPIQRYDDLKPVRELCRSQLAMVEGDIHSFQQALPNRIASLQLLASRPEIRTGQIAPQIFSITLLEERLANLQTDLARLKATMAETLSEVKDVEETRQAANGDPTVMRSDARLMLRDLLTGLYDELVELSLIEVRARLDTRHLTPIDLEFEEALEIARVNRHDWLKVRVQATETLPRSSESDLPRFWQQDCAVDDNIHLRLRRIVRDIREDQINFEVRRAAVFVALLRTDLTRIGLTAPMMGGGSTTARDVQEALQTLLRAQNDFLASWVDYETLRMNLDLELGTIQLDDRGMWIDPGPI